MTNTNATKFTFDDTTRIFSARLVEDHLRFARVLEGPVEVAGIAQIDLNGEQLWGHLGGQVVNRGGLSLSPIVYPTHHDAQRAWEAIGFGPDATAALIDRAIADRESTITRQLPRGRS